MGWNRIAWLPAGAFFFLLASGLPQAAEAQTPPLKERPKIGLTLSGGGAKGLAHIGILEAIDSAGLKIDYITGTSMGSIIGALYSVGYSADSIEKIARSIDWDLLLSNQSSLRSIFMEEKDEYDKYIFELPWLNNRFVLPTGLLEGEELWLKFSELFFPVYNIKDFSRFNIPFRCIGTDVGNGEAVVMKSGEINSAVRASMAIPSVFTAVDYNGKRLVDGGIVRNFPVRDVREMGAGYVIGSNVTSGLLPSQKVRNVIQILLQVAFFREAEDTKTEIPQCDIYVPFDMEKYSMGSFSDADKILEMGKEEGRKLYPRFKRLADSLNAIYGPQELEKNRLPVAGPVKISSYEVHGLVHTSSHFFVHTMNFATNRLYTAHKLADMVRRAYGTRYYSRVTYALEPRPDSTCRIIFDVTENPLTFAKLGLHYNPFTGIGVIANITSRNFFVTNSRDLATISLGESFQIRGEHLQYLGRLKDFSFILGTQFDRFDLTTYDQYKQNGLYKQNYFRFNEKFQFSGNRAFSVGIGHRFEWLHYRPSLSTGLAVDGSNHFNSFFFYIQHNTLDRGIYPHRGVKLDAEAAYVGTQHPELNFIVNGDPTPPDSIVVSTHPYTRTTLHFESYTPLSRRTTILFNMNGGINFNYTGNAMNEFIVGGLTKTFHNQVTFAGLEEGTLYTPTLAALEAGLRVQLLNNTYISGRANVLFDNFISTSSIFRNPDFLSGYALTFSYNFALGPLELSAMYCDQTKKVKTYINLGIPF